MAEATRSSVLAPGSALELLPSLAPGCPGTNGKKPGALAPRSGLGLDRRQSHKISFGQDLGTTSSGRFLGSSALSSARGSRTVGRHRHRRQPHLLGRFGAPVAWSRLGEPRRPRETAESTRRDNGENTLRVLRTHASIDNSNTAIGNRPSAVTLNPGIVVPLGRARRGPVWAGLDRHPMWEVERYKGNF